MSDIPSRLRGLYAAMNTVVDEIAAERCRQVEAEGWTPEHDDQHRNGEIANAAACYAYYSALSPEVREVDEMRHRNGCSEVVVIRRAWSWDWKWWKPKDRRRDLIRAGALIIAEIERLDRAKA